jgi:hypothetical protein
MATKQPNILIISAMTSAIGTLVSAADVVSGEAIGTQSTALTESTCHYQNKHGRNRQPHLAGKDGDENGGIREVRNMAARHAL